MLLHINAKFAMGKLWSSLSFLIAPHCQCRGVCQGMRQT
jgi:hypothetical protein